MGWAVGEDTRFGMERDIGYGVPAICDHPGCNEPIDRGLGYVCGGEPYGGDEGCGLFFCGSHLAHYRMVKSELADDRHSDLIEEGWSRAICEKCAAEEPHFDLKPDVHEWILWKAYHPSWRGWRRENRAWCWANVTLWFWSIWDAGCGVWDKVRWSRIGRKMGL